MQSIHIFFRGLALALGLFAFVNLVAGFRDPAFDPNLWWIDTRALPELAQDALVAIAAVLLIAWSIRPIARPWRRRVTLGCLALLIGLAVGNAVAFYGILVRGIIHTPVPFPFSLLVALLLAAFAWSVLRPPVGPAPARWQTLGLFCLAILAFGLLFPLIQAFLFGKTDYRRPADAILVLGARAYADGTPSDPLADRVRTACDLYAQGLAPLLIMSGGPGDGAIDETQAMQTFAESLGVPASAIMRDPQGINTAASIRNLDRLAHEQGLRRVMAVSHYWHLPRVKLAIGRRDLQVYTVPADEPRYLRQTPRMLMREVAAFWKYYATVL